MVRKRSRRNMRRRKGRKRLTCSILCVSKATFLGFNSFIEEQETLCLRGRSPSLPHIEIREVRPTATYILHVLN